MSPEDRGVGLSWEMMDSGQDVRSGSGPQLSDSLRLFLQETSAFKQQNPGKFCLLVCSLCTFFAVLGRYIPGIVISYVLVLGFFLWPLVSTHDVGSWLDPVLQKLDFGVGEFFQKIKENHEKRMMQVQTEKEGIESDLSSMFPKLDSAVCKDMSVSDTEVSDVTWTDNGTFNLSEGHTPQTENSEDLDREEAFTGGLPEFPQLPIKLKGPPPATDPALQLVNKMAGEFIAAAVTAAMQERIEAAVGFPTGDAAAAAVRSRTAGPSALLELDSDSEVEDFELLDQSELEQLEGELGLEERAPPTEAEAPPTEAEAPPTGFFSKLLRR